MSKTVKDSVLYTGSIYTINAIGVIAGIFVKRILGPAIVGSDAFILVLYSYANYVYSTVRSTVVREIPALQAQKRDEEARDLLNTSFTLILMSTLGISAVFLVYSLMYKDAIIRYGLMTYVFTNVFLSISTFFSTYLSTQKEFITIGKINLYGTVIKTVLLLVLSYYFSYKGYFAAVALGNLALLLYSIFSVKIRFRLDIKASEVKKTFVLGLPLVIYGLVFLSFQNMDRLMIKAYYPIEELGFYNIAVSFFTMMVMLPESICSVYFPRFIEHINSADKVFIESKIHEFLSVIKTIMPLIIGLSMVVIPLIIELILPAFRKGILPAQILLVGIYFYALFYIHYYYLMGIYKFGYILFSVLPVILMTYLMNLACIKMGWGIAGISVSMSVSYVLYSSLVIYLGQKELRYDVRSYSALILENICYCIPLVAVIVTGLLLPNVTVWRRMYWEAGVFMAINLPFFYYMNKRSNTTGRLKMLLVRQ